MSTAHDRLRNLILQTAGTADRIMATPTNETGAPPDEPIDLDAWFGAGNIHPTDLDFRGAGEARKLVDDAAKDSALSVTVSSW